MAKKQKKQQMSQSVQSAKPLTDYEDKPDSVKKHVPVAKDE